MQPETTIAVEAYARLERKMHQMEKSQAELTASVAQVEDGEMAEYVEVTTRLHYEIALKCRNGCAASARDDLIELAISDATEKGLAAAAEQVAGEDSPPQRLLSGAE